MAVVASSDAGWSWQSIFVINRAIEMDPTGQLEGHVFIHGTPDERLAKTLNPRVTLHIIDEVPAFFDKMLEINPKITGASLLRFTVLDILGEAYERILYMDGDIFQNWGNLFDLYSVDLKGATVAGVLDQGSWPENPRRRWNRYMAGLGMKPESKYMNAGFLMVDGPKYRAQGLTEKIFKFFTTNFAACQFGDQSALNGTLDGNWAELSAGWNWQYFLDTCELIPLYRPRLVHFTGNSKPWNDRLCLRPQAAFDAYYDFLHKWGLLDLLSSNVPISDHSEEEIATHVRRKKRFLTLAKDNYSSYAGYLNRRNHVDYNSNINSMISIPALKR